MPQGLGLYDDLTAAENLAFTAAIFGPGGGADRAVLPEEIRPYARELIGSLPLGVQRRVAFAQALSHRPDLLMLDEPTSGVDPLGRARLWETIAEAADAGAGVLVTTHYMEEAQECGRLVIMADGRVVAEGTAAEIVGSRQVVVVEAESWAAAFGALERSGLQVALAGRGLRVPGAEPGGVRQALGELPARGAAGSRDAGGALLRADQQRAGRGRRVTRRDGAGLRGGRAGRGRPTAPGRARPRGRPAARGDSGTREAIARGSRAQFAELGYHGATIRGIAAAAEVDPALVHHFYGTKEALFAAAMQLPVVPSEVLTAALRRPAGRRSLAGLRRAPGPDGAARSGSPMR